MNGLTASRSPRRGRKDEADFVQMILENLKTAGVQQAHKEDKISFSSIAPWPGYFVCAEGKYFEGDAKSEKASRDLRWSRIRNSFAARSWSLRPVKRATQLLMF